MLVFESALKIFKDNGYDSMSNYPLIYKGAEGLGITYKFNHKYYGELVRSKVFYEEVDLDKFLKSYKWYLTDGINKGVYIELDDYMKFDPEVIYKYDDYVINDVLSFDNFISSLNSNDDLNIHKLGAKKLFDSYKYIKRYIFNYIDSYNNTLVELHELYKSLQYLIDRYNLNKEDRVYEEYSFTKYVINYDEAKESKLINMYNTCSTLESYKEVISILFRFCVELELNSDFINLFEKRAILDHELGIVKEKISLISKLVDKSKLVDIKSKLIKLETKYVFDKDYNAKYRLGVIDRYKKYKDLLNNVSLIDDFKSSLSFGNVITEVVDEGIKNKLIIINSRYIDLVNMIKSVNNYQYMDITILVSKLKLIEGYDELYEVLFNGVFRILENNVDQVLINLFSCISFVDEEEFIKSILKLINDVFNTRMLLNLKFLIYKDSNVLLGSENSNIILNDNKDYYVGDINNVVGIKLVDKLDIDAEKGSLSVTEDNKVLIFKEYINIKNVDKSEVVNKYEANLNVEVNYKTVNSMKVIKEYRFMYCEINSRF